MADASVSFGSSPTTSNSCGPAFIDRIIKDCELEGKFESRFPLVMLEGIARKAVWQMCLDLDVDIHGIPGQACSLLEKFLAKHHEENFSSILNYADWVAFKEEQMTRTMLLMASCVRLAAKMTIPSVSMNAERIRNYLKTVSSGYSRKQIIDAELEVYKVLSYYVPSWTSVEIGMLLGQEILKMSPSSMKAIGIAVDYCEFNRNDIENNMECHRDPSSHIRTLHLTVGAVLVTADYLDVEGDITEKMALYVKIKLDYLKLLVSAIQLTIDNANETGESKTKRRKHS